MSSEIISQSLSTLKQTSKLSNINRKRVAVIGILKQTIPLWHPYLRMSFYGKLPFSFKYSESPRKDTMLQNILQTSPATPWKLPSSSRDASQAKRIPSLCSNPNLPVLSLSSNISRQHSGSLSLLLQESLSTLQKLTSLWYPPGTSFYQKCLLTASPESSCQ